MTKVTMKCSSQPNRLLRGASLVPVVALAVCSLQGHAQAEDSSLEAGKAFVEVTCGQCHATGTSGDSTHPDAPAFRTLSRSYPVESLAEALAEGIMTGHPDMPTFELSPEQVTGVIAFLASIQEP